MPRQTSNMDDDPRFRLAATESKLEAKAEAAKAEEALLNKRCAGSVGSAHGDEITLPAKNSTLLSNVAQYHPQNPKRYVTVLSVLLFLVHVSTAGVSVYNIHAYIPLFFVFFLTNKLRRIHELRKSQKENMAAAGEEFASLTRRYGPPSLFVV